MVFRRKARSLLFDSPVMAVPANLIEPESRVSSPPMQLSRVDFPDPEIPVRAVIRPVAAVAVKSRNSWFEPKLLFAFLISSMSDFFSGSRLCGCCSTSVGEGVRNYVRWRIWARSRAMMLKNTVSVVQTGMAKTDRAVKIDGASKRNIQLIGVLMAK